MDSISQARSSIHVVAGTTSQKNLVLYLTDKTGCQHSVKIVVPGKQMIGQNVNDVCAKVIDGIQKQVNAGSTLADTKSLKERIQEETGLQINLQQVNKRVVSQAQKMVIRSPSEPAPPAVNRHSNARNSMPEGGEAPAKAQENVAPLPKKPELAGGHADAFKLREDGFLEKSAGQAECEMYQKIREGGEFEKLQRFVPATKAGSDPETVAMEDLGKLVQSKGREITDVKLGSKTLFSRKIHDLRKGAEGALGLKKTARLVIKSIRMGILSEFSGDYAVQGSKKAVQGVIIDADRNVVAKNKYVVARIFGHEIGTQSKSAEGISRIFHSLKAESKDTIGSIKESIDNLSPDKKLELQKKLKEDLIGLKSALREAPVAFYGSSILLVRGKDPTTGESVTHVKFIDLGNHMTREEAERSPENEAEYDRLRANSDKAIDALIADLGVE